MKIPRFMHHSASIRFIILASTFAVLFNSCTKDPNKQIMYGWASSGTKLYFDRYSSTDTIKNSLTVTVVDHFFSVQANPHVSLQVLERRFKVKKGGLYGVSCNDCSMSNFFSCLSTFDFLYLPNAASLNQTLPVYGCGKTPRYSNQVIRVNETITVPQGQYQTFVLRSGDGHLSYWNPEYGLIMYELNDGNKKVTYKLSRTTSGRPARD